ncbi:hypothetical protein [Rheinheimera sp. 4Y26]|uniref:hypothetical protein n=1 Tax=Rheinheimera sp. 4Y26 TaxID=2977811 RepID=UPI0021B10B9F|nr:hypothetical protein [Rheinheimera sp. 4Y26]MCT6698628.1 hypothetical protein [Rheinheimera sp. 4Y26]
MLLPRVVKKSGLAFILYCRAAKNRWPEAVGQSSATPGLLFNAGTVLLIRLFNPVCLLKSSGYFLKNKHNNNSRQKGAAPPCIRNKPE